ncbi:MAG: CopG family transcriptional regulator [Hyphomicrobiaceae bacterium]
MRQRHALYLSEALSQRLQATAEAQRVSKSAILERALQRYLSSPSGGQTSDLTGLQHEATGRSLHRLERELAIASELMATFVRYFVTITPPLPSSEHAAARALGQLRFEQVIEEIARRLRTDRGLMARVMSKLDDSVARTAADSAGTDDDHAAPPSEFVPRRPA